jgi:hypothetical protein
LGDGRDRRHQQEPRDKCCQPHDESIYSDASNLIHVIATGRMSMKRVMLVVVCPVVVAAMAPGTMALSIAGKPARTTWKRGDVEFIGRGVTRESKNTGE